MKAEFAKGDDGKAITGIYARMLYSQAELMSGMEIENPAEFSRDINTLILGFDKAVEAENTTEAPAEAPASDAGDSVEPPTAETEPAEDGVETETTADESPTSDETEK